MDWVLVKERSKIWCQGLSFAKLSCEVWVGWRMKSHHGWRGKFGVVYEHQSGGWRGPVGKRVRSSLDQGECMSGGPRQSHRAPSSDRPWIWFHALLLPSWKAYDYWTRVLHLYSALGPHVLQLSCPHHSYSLPGLLSDQVRPALHSPRPSSPGPHWRTINSGNEKRSAVYLLERGQKSWRMYLFRNVSIEHWCTVKI